MLYTFIIAVILLVIYSLAVSTNEKKMPTNFFGWVLWVFTIIAWIAFVVKVIIWFWNIVY